jgi:hypothetical protein
MCPSVLSQWNSVWPTTIYFPMTHLNIVHQSSSTK